jgi:hypothetical protein
MLDEFFRIIPPKRDSYLHRDAGFFAERATSIYVEKLQREGAKVLISNVGQIESLDPDSADRDYTDRDKVFKTINELFAGSKMAGCRNEIVRALPHMQEEDQITLHLYMRCFTIYDLEKRHCRVSLFEYLPPALSDTLERTSKTVTALYMGVRQLLENPCEANEKTLLDLLDQTGFSGLALYFILHNNFNIPQAYEYTGALLIENGMQQKYYELIKGLENAV